MVLLFGGRGSCSPAGDSHNVHTLTLLALFLLMLVAENVTAQLSDPASCGQTSLPWQTLVSPGLEARRNCLP